MKKLFTNKILQCFILLIFVLLLHISLGYKLRPFYVLTFTAFLLCLSGYFKRTYFIFIILLMMVGAIYSPIGLKYGSPNINSIISIFYTNTHESLEFILSVSPISLAFSCLLILFGLLSLKVNLLIGKKLSLFTVSIFILTSVTWPVKALITHDDYSFEAKLPIIRFFSDIKKHYDTVLSLIHI